MRDAFAERLLNDFVFADSRLGSHPVTRAASLWLEGRQFVAGEAAPPHRIDRDIRIPWDAGVCGLAFRRRTAVTVVDRDLSKEGAVRWDLSQEVLEAPYISILAVPLFDANQPIGVLSFDCTIPDFFLERHLGAARLLGALLVYVHWHAKERISTPASRAVGEALRQARQALGLSQDELGTRLGINRITLSRHESGAQPPSRDALYRWCGALGLVATTTAARVQVVEITPTIQRLLQQDPRRLAQLSPEQFEQFIAERLDRMGYDVTLAGATTLKDGGIDLIAVPKVRTVGSFLLAGQVKHHETGRKTGRPAVDRLLAWKDSPFRLGLLVTNTEFTKDALWVAGLEQHRAFLRLRDFDDLKRWIQDDFTSERDWREIPEAINLAPGIVVRVPRHTLTRPELVWPVAPTVLRHG